MKANKNYMVETLRSGCEINKVSILNQSVEMPLIAGAVKTSARPKVLVKSNRPFSKIEKKVLSKSIKNLASQTNDSKALRNLITKLTQETTKVADSTPFLKPRKNQKNNSTQAKDVLLEGNYSGLLEDNGFIPTSKHDIPQLKVTQNNELLINSEINTTNNAIINTTSNINEELNQNFDNTMETHDSTINSIDSDCEKLSNTVNLMTQTINNEIENSEIQRDKIKFCLSRSPLTKI